MKLAISLVAGVLMFGTATGALAGNAAAGKAKSGMCAGCHGVDGNSAAPNFPKLAGQNAGYIAKQLADFKSGARKDATMAGMAAALSKKDMEDLGAYYESQAGSAGAASGSPAQIAAAERLYRGGDAKRGVAACMSCHGPAGTGIPPRYPRVSGQHAAYNEAQLLAFKRGTRSNDGAVMTSLAFKLSEQEIRALADYMAGLH
jgi:cytochrome c553